MASTQYLNYTSMKYAVAQKKNHSSILNFDSRGTLLRKSQQGGILNT